MLQAFRDDRPGAFTAELSGDAAEKFTEKEFTSSRAVLTENLGEIARTEFLDRLASPVFETYLWKVAFVREKSDGEKLLQETLFRLVVAQGKDKAPVILSFGFL